jgi:LysR family hydrogen peroxide-inducible transcriptional activator
MDLRQLNALLAVAEHGSFSAAARSLHTVQSNVSTHVARLERELGVTLIDRATSTLTAEGEVVTARARRIQSELDALGADIASLHDEVSGSVRIGVIGTTARWLVPLLMAAMTEQHPKIHVVIVDATTSSLLPQLESGHLDLAIVNLPLPESDLVADELFEEDHVLIAPAGHALFDRDRIELVDLVGIPLLLEPQGTGFRDHLDAQAAAAGVELTPFAEVDGMRLLASLAFGGFGAGVVPASAAPGRQTADWKRVAVAGLGRRAVGLARRKRGLLSAPARALCDVLREVILAEGADESGIHPTIST